MYRKNEEKSMQLLAELKAVNFANELKDYINSKFELAKTLSASFSTIKAPKNKQHISRDFANSMIQSTLDVHQDVLGIFTIWEPNAFDRHDSLYVYKPGHDQTGRFLPLWTRDKNNSFVVEPLIDYEIKGSGDYYQKPKLSLQEAVIPPYYYPIQGQEILQISLVAPINYDYTFYGVVGVNVAVSSVQEFLHKNKIFGENTQITVVSNNGLIVADNFNPNFLGQHLKQIKPDWKSYMSYIQVGMKKIISSDKEKIIVEIPFILGNTAVPWGIIVSMPVSEISENVQINYSQVLLLSLIFIFVSALLVYYFTNRLLMPLSDLAQITEQVAVGNLDSKMKTKLRGSEIKRVAGAVNKLIEGLRIISDFASQIGKGNFDMNYTPLSNRDLIGNSLINMRESLHTARSERLKREEADAKENWIIEGLRLFDDILRQSYNSLSELTAKLVAALVKHVEVNQAGIFILNDSDKSDIYLELSAAYAYDRRKKLQKKIKFREGLVGTCAVEKKIIHLSEIPDNYINIGSGLGTANPKTLILIPLLLNEKVFGVFEIASFTELQEHQITFLENLSKNIATTLSSVKITHQTSLLLAQSQKQAEELALTEREMRSTIEKLQATQKEAAQGELKAKSFIKLVNQTLIRLDLDLEGRIILANAKFLELFNYTKTEIQGKYLVSFMNEANQNKFMPEWERLLTGSEFYQTEIQYNNENLDVWLLNTFSPLKDTTGVVKSIVLLAYDITESKIRSSEVEKLLKDSQEKAEILSAQEEEMRVHLETLHTAKQELEERSEKIEIINKKMKTNEQILRKQVEKSRQDKKKLKRIEKEMENLQKTTETNRKQENEYKKQIAQLNIEIERLKRN